MVIDLPAEVKGIIEKLEASGHEAYIVGGCVRDSLCLAAPKDWDVCTSAPPEQTLNVFSGENVIETGLQHGTVTVVLNHKPFEITTYRSDGIYSDSRHPDSVEFLTDIKGDLSRRDFTINAMAYSPKAGVVDFFGGIEDLKNGLLKCVGDPDERFQEDALRILRAMRFASTLEMKIEENTAKAMFSNRGLLGRISKERIASELNGMIVGTGAYDVFVEHAAILLEIIPELAPALGFEQNNPHHCYDVLTHTFKSIDSAPKDLAVRLALLFHDIAKPICYSLENGVGHFFGHQQAGAEIAGKVLSRLKYDNDTVSAVKKLVLHHDSEILPESRNVKRWLNRIGETGLRQLVEVKRADIMAQAERYRQERLDILKDVSGTIDEVIEQRQCFSLKDLAVTGREMMEIGIPPGPQIGKMLKLLVDMVIDEQVDNSKEELMRVAERSAESMK